MTRPSDLRRGALALALAVAAACTPALAEEGDLDEVVVFGRGEKQIGVAAASSEGVVAGADLSVRPMLRVAELLEAVPGMIAAQHSGSGKANQYFLRGFNLDHGTDFTAYIDDMPWNLRTHGHGQGYLDVNGLIPEVVDRIEYRKGPYRADIGDFAMAGASFMTTIDRLPTPFVAVEGGQYGWGRVAGGGTTSMGGGDLTLLGQWKTYDGPWELPEQLDHYSVWGKFAKPLDFAKLEVTLSGYRATWHPTEQSPEASIGTSACADVFCALDTTAFGKTLRWIGTAKLAAEHWSASAYAQYYDWHMLSDPTYDFQIDQFDRRWTAGGRYENHVYNTGPLQISVGAEARYDRMEKVGVNHTEDGLFVENTSDNAVREGSLSAYTEATWRPVDKLRLMAGLRADAYDFNVGTRPDAGASTVSGKADDQIVSPKAGAAWSLNDSVELYANWGRGFHSNDARGAVNTESPVPGLVKGEGYEGGMRYERGSFNVTATYWWLELDSELIFVGDSNAVEPKSGAKRKGLELVAFWRPVSWLGLDAVYTQSHARYVAVQDDPDYDPGVPALSGLQGTHVEGGVESAGEFGASAVRGRWEASMRVRYLGPYALVPSNTKRADAETMVNLRLAFKPGHFTVYGELLNVLDDHGKDIEYYYPSYIPGVLPPGEQEATRMSRAEEPRTVRVGLKYSF
ncbi:MAG TPA: TonB-dependent receptor [Steroidobacteraceae bacterium]|nr:TonB-dependent receptor [Steroidobacteraceae bacterium]